MDNDMIALMREKDNERFHKLWLKAKTNKFAGMTEEDQQMMKIMLEHQDEYTDIFENPDLLAEYEADPETGQNPFIHITMHSIVENQLKNRQPIEAYQFYLAMLQKKYSRHLTIHLIAAIIGYLLFPTLKYKQPFDNERYKRALTNLKNKKPEKIWAYLEEHGLPE